MNAHHRTVVVGFGAVADRLADDPVMARHFAYASHVQALAALPAMGWDAVVDPDPAARARARDRWGIARVVASLDALADAAAYDIAVLAGPPATRAVALDRLPGLRAVLVEKPIAADAAGAERFASRLRAGRVLAQVNHWRRAEPGCRALAAGGLAARIGRVQGAFAVYGNGLDNNGSHLVDMIRMLLGEPVAARALGPARAVAGAPLAGDVAVPFTLTFGDDVCVTAHPIDFRRYREIALDIWGTEGRLVIDQETLAARALPVRPHRALAEAREIAADAAEAVPLAPGCALRLMHENLLEALDRGAPLVAPLDDALTTARAVAAIRRSAERDGAPMALPPPGPAILVADAH
jgi:predicted dehydrogenase